MPLIDPVDAHIGARVKLRRKLMGLSQTRLGAAIGLTFQQVQKYERGSNRIAASTLYQIAGILDVPVSFFFDAMEDGLGHPPPSPVDGLGARDAAELLHHFQRIPRPLRPPALALLRAMAG